MKSIFKITFFLILNAIFLSCSQQQQNSETSDSTISDTLTETEENNENEAVEEEIDEAEVMDESWKEVKIGNQVWMSTNLNVSKFRNGDPIPQAKSNEEWATAAKNKKPAWCYYKNNTENGVKYGKLYNWFAVNDQRGLAPEGWHVSTDDEWIQLINNIGGDYDLGFTEVGDKLKNSTGWAELRGRNGNGNNQTGFSALPGMYRGEKGNWFGGEMGSTGQWWTSTEYSVLYAFSYSLNTQSNYLTKFNNNYMGFGLSVRCVKD